MAWNIVLFESSRKEKVVKEFIKNLNIPTSVKIAHTIELLQNHGPYLRMPHSKKLSKRLFELRIRGTEEIRIIYAFVEKNIYLLHAFKKKKQKTPKKEIVIAEQRLSALT